jgi:hypothetical protein
MMEGRLVRFFAHLGGKRGGQSLARIFLNRFSNHIKTANQLSGNPFIHNMLEKAAP